MSLGWRLKSSNHVIQILCRVSRLTTSRKPLVLFLKVLDDIRSNTFLYIKILVSEQSDSGNLKITNLDRLIFTKNGEFTI